MKILFLKFILISIALSYTTTKLYAQITQRLSVGDQAPTLNAYRWIKGDSLTTWTGHELYLIEFGATWCSPCIAAIPELTAIQQKFKQNVRVVSVFVQEAHRENGKHVDIVRSFVKKRAAKIDYSIAVDWPDSRINQDWIVAANLTGIPHLFVVNKAGEIKWIGANPKSAEEAIARILQKEQPVASEESGYDPGKLLLIDNNGGNQSDFIFRSMLTRYDGKISGLGFDHIFSFHVFKPDTLYPEFKDKLELIGYPVSTMYYLAYSDTLTNMVRWRHNGEYPDTVKMPYTRTTYGKSWHKAVVEASDTSIFTYRYNNTRNRFNYSLKVPPNTGSARFLQSTLKRDLETYFGFNVSIETRKMPCWNIQIGDKRKVATKLISKNQMLPINISNQNQDEPFVFKNVDMRDIVTAFALRYGHGSFYHSQLPFDQQGPFIDLTGIKDKIDFSYNPKWTFAEFVNYFESMGLSVTKSNRDMKVVVIHD